MRLVYLKSYHPRRIYPKDMRVGMNVKMTGWDTPDGKRPINCPHPESVFPITIHITAIDTMFRFKFTHKCRAWQSNYDADQTGQVGLKEFNPYVWEIDE